MTWLCLEAEIASEFAEYSAWEARPEGPAERSVFEWARWRREAQRESNQRRRKRLRAMQRCAYCGKPSHAWRCGECLAKTVKRQYKRIHERRARGECVVCGEPVEGGSRLCAKHTASRNAGRRSLAARRASEGLCQCGMRAVSGRRKCPVCIARNREYQRRCRERKAMQTVGSEARAAA